MRSRHNLDRYYWRDLMSAQRENNECRDATAIAMVLCRKLSAEWAKMPVTIADKFASPRGASTAWAMLQQVAKAADDAGVRPEVWKQ